MKRLSVRLGVDLVDIGRVERMMAEDETFVAFAFTERERAACHGDPARLATRWAAKEAVMKALGRGIGRIAPLDIEVISDDFGQPSLNLTRSALERSTEIGTSDWAVTLSHENNMAIAAVFAVIGGNDE